MGLLESTPELIACNPTALRFFKKKKTLIKIRTPIATNSAISRKFKPPPNKIL